MKRVLPAVIAVVVLAVVALGLWWFNRPAPIPTTMPSTAPAVGSCWNVDATTMAGTLPWPSGPVACTSPHTAEVFYRGQVDHALLANKRTAKGQAAQVNDLLIMAEARAGCSGHVGAFLGGAWRQARVSLIPTFVAPIGNGFFACALAQVSDPGGQHVVSRSATLQGALSGPNASAITIDCYAHGQDGTATFTSCDTGHSGEFVGIFTVTPLGAPYDGPELQTTVTKGCQSIVDSVLGLPAGTPSRSDLRASFVGPTSSVTWVGSDQTFACYASADTVIQGSIKGLGTRPLPR